MRMCAEIRYILSDAFYSTYELFPSFFNTIGEEYDLDIDKIADLSELNSLPLLESVDKIIKYLYENSNPILKSKIFYKVMHESKITIDMVVEDLYKSLEQYCFRMDENMNNLNDSEIINLLNNSRSFNYIPQDSLDNFHLNDFHLNDFNFYFNFESKFIELFNYLKERVYYSFDQIIKMEYKARQNKNLRVLNYYIDNNSYNNNTTMNYISTSYQNEIIGSIINDNSTSTTVTIYTNLNNNGFSNPLTYGTNVPTQINILNPTQTNTINIINTSVANRIINKQKLIKKPKIQKTKSYSILKKSLKGIIKFLSFKELNTILGDGLIIEGIEFNFKIKANKKNLLTYSERLDNFSISYDLFLLDKLNNLLCKICIVHKGCPILDEILIIYLMIKTGKEKDIIEVGNHFSKSEEYFNYFKSEENKHNIGPSLEVERRIRFKTIIAEWVLKRLRKSIPSEILNYIWNLDVSWNEAVSFASLEYFNVEVFDKYVKKFNWEPFERIKINQNNKVLDISENNLLNIIKNKG